MVTALGAVGKARCYTFCKCECDANNSQQLSCAQLSCKYGSEDGVVTSNSRQICICIRRKYEPGFTCCSI